MLREVIEVTTYKKGLVLDCFGGSGSTSIAAMATGRASITIEIEPQWAKLIADRVAEAARTDREELLRVRSMRDVDELAIPRLL